MEVSTLRDRRLVALFATLVIGGSGVAAAVVSLEGGPVYQGPAATEAALAPLFSESPEPSRPVDRPPEHQAPVVVAVVAEDPPLPTNSVVTPSNTPSSKPTSSNTTSSNTSTASAPDLCAATDAMPKGPRAPKANGDCGAPSKPTPAPKLAPAGGGAVVAAEDPDPTEKPKRPHRTKDAELAIDEDSEPPKPAPVPKPDKPVDPVVVVVPAPDPGPQGEPAPPARPDTGPKVRAVDEAPKPPPSPKPAPGAKPASAKGKLGR
jgi:fused signal recognition particle receptor